MRFLKLILLTLSCLLLTLILPTQTALHAQTVAPTQPASPQKLLSISFLPRLDPMPDQAGMIKVYVEAVDLTYNAGARGNFLSKHWSELEPTPGKFALDDLKNYVNYIEKTRGFYTMLGIQVINTTSREVPSDLKDVPFDSDEMKSRFHALIDAVAPYISAQTLYLSIGNEVDAYLGVHNEWDSYLAFYEDAATYVKRKFPALKIGITVTFNGATKQWADQVQKLTAANDVYIVTYYPLNMDFTVRAPDSPLTDFPILLKQAGKRPLLLQEVGYPASELLNSSEQKQAEFVRNVFKAWTQAGDRLPLLNYFLLHDFTGDMCKQFLTYYHLPNSQQFYDYLCTLGLRKANGTPRLAWKTFVESAATAGFR